MGGVDHSYLGGGNAKKESPNFRFPEFGISGLCTTTSANTLTALVHLTINIFSQLSAFTSLL